MSPDRTAALAALRADGICVLFDPAHRADWIDVLGDLQAVGVPWFQLRSKQAAASTRAGWAYEARRVLDRSVLIINDDPELAYRCGADGVHVGADDSSPGAARSLMGADALIGATGSGGRWATLGAAPVDYLGIGPLRASQTKADTPAPLGAAGLLAAAAAASHPVVAIGGIVAGDLAALRRGGAAGAAVQGAVWEAPDPAAAAAALLEAWRCG